MNDHDWSAGYVAAMERFEKHLHRADDGTLWLDTDNGRDMGIDDPTIFADLKRSLEVTNKKIKNGEIDPRQVTNIDI